MDERSMRGLNLAFRFILELLALVALFLWGTSVSDDLVDPARRRAGRAGPRDGVVEPVRGSQGVTPVA